MTEESGAMMATSAELAFEEVAASEPMYAPVVFFPVSARKFIVMSVVSGGLYPIYWSYRNWRYIKQLDDSRIMPFWRAWFVLFFQYSLLKRIKTETSKRTLVLYTPGVLAVFYFMFQFAYRLPGAWGYIGFLEFVPLLPVIWAINAANEGRVSPESMNTRFTGWNLTLILFGVVLLASDVVLWVRPDLMPS